MGYTENDLAKDLENSEYKFGFTTDIKSDRAPLGLNEDIIRFISAKKEEPEWLLDYRLKCFQIWSEMTEPSWAHITYPKPDFQGISYYAAPKQTKKYESWDDVDPEMKETMAKLGVSMEEQQRLTGVAVDFVMDSVSVATSFKSKLKELGIIFCSFSEAVQEYPELVKQYMGSVVPATDNFYFDQKNLYFHYSPYEITAFAAGDIIIPISWDELKGTLNEEFKERMKIK
jgi:Fe-S cluster assembly protein SufB